MKYELFLPILSYNEHLIGRVTEKAQNEYNGMNQKMVKFFSEIYKTRL